MDSWLGEEAFISRLDCKAVILNLLQHSERFHDRRPWGVS